MKWIYILVVTLILPITTDAQKEHKKEVKSFWRSHKSGLQQKFDGPLKPKDLKKLDFFPLSNKWKIKTEVEKVKDGPVLKMPTSASKIKEYRLYARLHFEIEGHKYHLPVYEMAGLNPDPVYTNYLFLPFMDKTNGELSYGGGRYLDLDKREIRNGYLWLDFNKAYNPYCAYADGWNCPIPPPENKLKIAVTAGEKIYKGPRRSRK